MRDNVFRTASCLKNSLPSAARISWDWPENPLPNSSLKRPTEYNGQQEFWMPEHRSNAHSSPHLQPQLSLSYPNLPVSHPRK